MRKFLQTRENDVIQRHIKKKTCWTKFDISFGDESVDIRRTCFSDALTDNTVPTIDISTI